MFELGSTNLINILNVPHHRLQKINDFIIKCHQECHAIIENVYKKDHQTLIRNQTEWESYTRDKAIFSVAVKLTDTSSMYDQTMIFESGPINYCIPYPPQMQTQNIEHLFYKTFGFMIKGENFDKLNSEKGKFKMLTENEVNDRYKKFNMKQKSESVSETMKINIRKSLFVFFDIENHKHSLKKYINKRNYCI